MTTFVLFKETRTNIKGLSRHEKTTDRVGCSNTLMNSLNEVISVNFARIL